MKTLANLKLNDTFKFAQAHEVFYEIENCYRQSYDVDTFTEYIVLKKNINSVKCRPVQSNVEFTFKYRGYFNNYIPAVDSEIIITTKCTVCGGELTEIKREFTGIFRNLKPDCLVCKSCERL